MSHFSSGKCHLHKLCGEFSLFCLQSTCLTILHSPLRFRSSPLIPPVREFPSVQKPTPPPPPRLLHNSLPQGAGLYPEILCLPFSLYLLLYLTPMRLVCLSRSLKMFRRCLVWTCSPRKWFFYLWGRRCSPCSVPPPSWKSPLHIFILVNQNKRLNIKVVWKSSFSIYQAR